MMKNWIRASLLLFLCTAGLFGQDNINGGLVVTGTVTGLNAVAECQGISGRILIQVQLYLQIRNESDRPLIYFKTGGVHELFGGKVGQTEVIFLQGLPSKTDGDQGTLPVIETRLEDCYYRPYYSNSYDPFDSFLRALDGAQPTSDFLVIEPQGYREFREYITLDTGYSLDVKVGRNLKESRPRAEYPAFQIKYHLSLKGHGTDNGILKDLKLKWKPYGDLILDGNGDFTIISEPIINKAPE